MQSSINRAILSVLVVVFSLWLIYSVRSALLPFIIAIILAYLLHHFVDILNKYKISRGVASLLILSIFFLIISAVAIVIVPIIFHQFIDLVTVAPSYLQSFKSETFPKILEAIAKLNLGLEENFAQLAEKTDIGDAIFSASEDFVSNVISSSFTFINILAIVFVTPVLLFYFLKDWHLIGESVFKYLPKKIAQDLRELSKEIHITLISYVKGQINVCLILATFYGLAFTFVGLDFGFMIGFGTGLMTFIPYVGSTIGIATAIIVALFQWGFDFFHLSIIIAIFAAGQFLEGNVLVPKLVGSKIGLHPLWVIFGLFACALLFGFIGILLAVPLTAIAGTIIKFSFKKYHA